MSQREDELLRALDLTERFRKTTMHMSYGNPGVKAGSGQLWSTLIRLAILVSAAAALLAILLVGLFVVLPLVFLGDNSPILNSDARAPTFQLPGSGLLWQSSPCCDVGLSHLRSIGTAPHLGDDCHVLLLYLPR